MRVVVLSRDRWLRNAVSTRLGQEPEPLQPTGAANPLRIHDFYETACATLDQMTSAPAHCERASPVVVFSDLWPGGGPVSCLRSDTWGSLLSRLMLTYPEVLFVPVPVLPQPTTLQSGRSRWPMAERLRKHLSPDPWRGTMELLDARIDPLFDPLGYRAELLGMLRESTAPSKFEEVVVVAGDHSDAMLYALAGMRCGGPVHVIGSRAMANLLLSETVPGEKILAVEDQHVIFPDGAIPDLRPSGDFERRSAEYPALSELERVSTKHVDRWCREKSSERSQRRRRTLSGRNHAILRLQSELLREEAGGGGWRPIDWLKSQVRRRINRLKSQARRRINWLKFQVRLRYSIGGSDALTRPQGGPTAAREKIKLVSIGQHLLARGARLLIWLKSQVRRRINWLKSQVRRRINWLKSQVRLPSSIGGSDALTRPQGGPTAAREKIELVPIGQHLLARGAEFDSSSMSFDNAVVTAVRGHLLFAACMDAEPALAAQGAMMSHVHEVAAECLVSRHQRSLGLEDRLKRLKWDVAQPFEAAQTRDDDIDRASTPIPRPRTAPVVRRRPFALSTTRRHTVAWVTATGGDRLGQLLGRHGHGDDQDLAFTLARVESALAARILNTGWLGGLAYWGRRYFIALTSGAHPLLGLFAMLGLGSVITVLLFTGPLNWNQSPPPIRPTAGALTEAEKRCREPAVSSPRFVEVLPAAALLVISGSQPLHLAEWEQCHPRLSLYLESLTVLAALFGLIHIGIGISFAFIRISQR